MVASRLSRKEILAIYAQDSEAVVALADALVDRFLAQVAALGARVGALEAARAEDSHNSGKPPSTDATRAGCALWSPAWADGEGAGGQPATPAARSPCGWHLT